MIRSKIRVSMNYLVLVVFSVSIIFGCAAPEGTDLETTFMEEERMPSVVKVNRIATETLVGKIRVTVEANAPIHDKYAAFKLTDPLRLVLDLPNSDTSEVSEITFNNTSPIRRITPFQFTDRDMINSRIEIALSRLVPYHVFGDANKLFIDLEMPVEEAAVTPPAISSLPPGFEELTPVLEKPQQQLISPVLEKPQQQLMPPVAATPAPQPVLPSIEIQKPPQLVGNVTQLPGIITGTSMIKNMDVMEVEGKTRVILYTDPIPEFDVKRTETPSRLTMDLKKSDLPPGTEQVITPDALETTVKQIRLFQLRRTPDGNDNVVRILVDLMRPTKYEVTTEPGKLILDISHASLLAAAVPGGEGITEVPLTTGIETALEEDQMVAEAEMATTPTIRAPKTGEEKEYKGQLISIQFQEATIVDVLQVISEVSGLNLVIHPGVSGTVTVRLTNVPWDQALDIILKMNNLKVEIEGNILRVAAASVFQKEVDEKIQQQRQKIEARKLEQELEPLETKLITVNFAEPSSLVSLITQYFQGATAGTARQERRGTITVDARTKTLIVQDTTDNIKKIEQIVTTLDRRTPQVMIEAKVVTISSTIRKELGIDWGGTFSADPAHGNPLDYRFPYTVDMPFGVNLPSLSGDAYGSLGTIQFGSIDDVLSIFARIDAAEQNDQAKTLGQPKIYTQDNIAASVTAEQVRTKTEVVGDNITKTTVSAPLNLSVTPRISSDGFITMVVSVTNASFLSPDFNDVTTTSQTISSQITVRDGETVVVGGIFATDESENFKAVPYLHRIPVVGRLFKSTLPNQKTQRELLVFMTPRILDRTTLKPPESFDVSSSY